MKSAWNILGIVAMVALVVSATPLSAQEKIKEGAETTKNAVVKGAKVVGGKTKEGLSKSGEVMTDGWITSRVHQRFITDALLKDSDINVDTNDHVVTLKGTVTSAAARNKAATIAKRTEGVHQVVNQLTIGPKRG